ncbi:MAG: hypothetical protein LLG45_02005 [Actinomycetia bacterium]|nr:hypothetical protein [Actinomycetes bacterium]
MLEEEAHKKYGSDLARAVVETADVVLAELEESARRRAHDTLTSIFLRAGAVALADMLAGRPLADAEEAHAPFQQAVNDAEWAVIEARSSWKAQMMDLMRHPPTGGTQIPSADSTAVDQAWQALKDAQTRAEETGRHLRSMREKIERLRAIPGPDPADVALLARVLTSGIVDDSRT